MRSIGYYTVNWIIIGLSSLALITFWSSCQEDPVHDSDIVNLSFSLDTLRFDTVFTELGSITRSFKIYNNESSSVIVSNLKLNSAATSFFRLNVDGFEGPDISNFRIEPNDSIYVFVEATIDPNQPLSASPFVIEELISITANESEYVVYLEAWGQNANYRPNRFSAAQINTLPCVGGTIIWNDPKPYVIYGVLVVDNCRLVISEGTKIYVHGGVAINDIGIYSDGILFISESGSISSNGTVANPVSIQSDRLEESFQDDSGQWRGIVIQAGSQNNSFEYTDIKHAIQGISVDSAATLDLNSVSIGYTSDSGLSASHAIVTAKNCLFYENGANGINFNFGGQYQVDYCSIANYNNQGSALSMNNFRCIDPMCEEPPLYFPLRARFNNCIIAGNEEDEISLFDLTAGEPGFFDYQINNSVVIVDELIEDDAFPDFFDHCNNCIDASRSDTLFLNIEEIDFHLDTMSIALDKAVAIPNINIDIEGSPRPDVGPDIGCYELQK